MGIDITQWRIEIAKYYKYVGRRRHSRGKSQGVKTASATSCNPLLALMLSFCLITAPSLLLAAGDVERNPGPPKLQNIESKLNIDDLGAVWEAVFPSRTKSYELGLMLKVRVDSLDSIAAQFDAPRDKLRETLKVWLRTATKPTWQAILDALRSPVVGESSLAIDIEAKYCTQVIPEAQLPQQPESDTVQTLQQALQDSGELRIIKDKELQDSQRCMDTLQQELQDSQELLRKKDQKLQDSQEQIQQLKLQVEEKQHTMDARETRLTQQLQTVEQDLQQHKLTNHELRAANDQLRKELHWAAAKPQDTIIQLKRQLQQTKQQVEEMQYALGARETQLQQLNQDLLQHKQITEELKVANDRLRQELQQAVAKKQALERRLQELTQQVQVMKRPPSIAVTQKKTIRDMKWQKKSKAPEKMCRGSAASDSNMAYFNGRYSTKVYSYDSDTQKWRQLPDTPHTRSTLVMVEHILTMVGGYVSGKLTNSLLSLMGEGGATKWLPHYPAMPTARTSTAAVCSGHSLIVTGGTNGLNSLATVEVLDTDTQQWSTACSLPHPFYQATILICREQLYLMGGCDETGLSHSVLTCSVRELLQSQIQPLTGKLQEAPAKQTTKWRHVADAPHYYSSCATLSGQLVAVGGSDGDKITAAIFGYNETKDSWEALGDIPTARSLALVAILNGNLMAVGGSVGGYDYVDPWWGTATDVVEILC